MRFKRCLTKLATREDGSSWNSDWTKGGEQLSVFECSVKFHAERSIISLSPSISWTSKQGCPLKMMQMRSVRSSLDGIDLISSTCYTMTAADRNCICSQSVTEAMIKTKNIMISRIRNPE